MAGTSVAWDERATEAATSCPAPRASARSPVPQRGGPGAAARAPPGHGDGARLRVTYTVDANRWLCITVHDLQRKSGPEGGAPRGEAAVAMAKGAPSPGERSPRELGAARSTPPGPSGMRPCSRCGIGPRAGSPRTRPRATGSATSHGCAPSTSTGAASASAPKPRASSRELGKMLFGVQDIVVGHKHFDRRYLVQGTDAATAKALFAADARGPLRSRSTGAPSHGGPCGAGVRTSTSGGDLDRRGRARVPGRRPPPCAPRRARLRAVRESPRGHRARSSWSGRDEVDLGRSGGCAAGAGRSRSCTSTLWDGDAIRREAAGDSASWAIRARVPALVEALEAEDAELRGDRGRVAGARWASAGPWGRSPRSWPTGGCAGGRLVPDHAARALERSARRRSWKRSAARSQGTTSRCVPEVGARGPRWRARARGRDGAARTCGRGGRRPHPGVARGMELRARAAPHRGDHGVGSHAGGVHADHCRVGGEGVPSQTGGARAGRPETLPRVRPARPRDATDCHAPRTPDPTNRAGRARRMIDRALDDAWRRGRALAPSPPLAAA